MAQEFKEGLGIDKLYHFIAGAILCGIFGSLNPYGGLVIACLFGLGKEILDQECDGKFDWMDLLFTVLGGLTIFAILIML